MSRVPQLFQCECLCGKGRTAAAVRTFEGVVECSTNAAIEILFKVDLLPVGQDRALVLLLLQNWNDVIALFVRPFNDVSVGPVLERLACVSSQMGRFRSGSLHESNKRMRTLKSYAGRNSTWLLRFHVVQMVCIFCCCEKTQAWHNNK